MIKKENRKLVVVGVIALVVLLEFLIVVATLAFDAYVAWAWGTDFTISWLVLDISHQYPFVPFAVGSVTFLFLGVLFAHLFAGQHGDTPNISYNSDRDTEVK